MSQDAADPTELERKTQEDLEDLALGEDYALNAEFVELVVDAADRGDTERLRELVGALHPADVADLMGFLSADYREEIIPLLDPEALAEILSELETNLREEVLETVSPATLAKALEDLDSDDAADVIDKYHLISAPVVEPGGRLVGQITVDDVVGVIAEESEEDMLALAGVSDAGRDASMAGVVRSRLPWLVLNLFTETIAVSA